MKRILWISDIHLSASPSPDAKTLIDKFVEKVNEEEMNFDFLVISGDIAFSGENKKSYKNFREWLVNPIKDKIDQIICVPGNHDVKWENAKKEIFYRVFEDNDIDIKGIAKKILGENYFDAVFQNYKEFHTSINAQILSETFSNIIPFDNHNIVFIALNSAWLSIGKPQKDTQIKVIEYLKTSFHLIDGKKNHFSEHGSQVYGFSIDELYKKLSAISQELSSKYQNYMKVLVAHHPPNWLDWEEMYSQGSHSSKFQMFMESNNIDLMLVGHEHTSQVIGDLLFGRTLVLKAGMFLDHHDSNTPTNNWFKILEIDDSRDIKEKAFNYQYKSPPIWKEINEPVVYSYSNLKSFVKPNNVEDLTKYMNPKTKEMRSETARKMDYDYLKSVIIEIDDTFNFQEILQQKLSIKVKLQESIPPKIIGPEQARNILVYKEVEPEKENFYYIIPNMNDIFDNYVKKSFDNLYLRCILDSLDKDHNYNIFVYFIGFYNNFEKDNSLNEVKFALESLFIQFRKDIFENDLCIEKISDARLAFYLHLNND